MYRAFVLVLVLVLYTDACVRRPVPEFTIDLDSAPEQRFSEVVQHFNSSIHAFYQKYLNHASLKAFLFGLVAKRGPENPELDGEITGLSQLSGLPKSVLHAIQFLYELQTVMVPILNVTIPWRGPGCLGIIAKNSDDGIVYHARNQDFSPAPYMQNLVYTGIFTKGGSELFRAQMLAGYSVPLTGMKSGQDGFSFETNTRYLDHKGGNSELLKNLLDEKRPLNGWTVRKAVEGASGYGALVEKLSTAPLVATEYLIIAGVRKGTILARNPDGLAHQLILGQENYECRNDYIIVSNFDYWWNDIREWFDPTDSGGIFRPRRIQAQKILNSSNVLSPDLVFNAINSKGAIATDTIYQAVMSVEKGLFNVSLPACEKCCTKMR